MCITNQFAEKTLKSIREFEAGNKDESHLAETLASIKSLQECLEENEKRIKKVLKETYSGEVYFFPEIGKKVYLSEGRKSTEVNPADVYLTMKNEGIENMFPDVVSISLTKVKEFPAVEKIVNIFKKENQGDPYITVYKMNKQELVEHKA